MAEPAKTRWRRRAVTIPSMLASTTVAFLGLPILLPAAVAADLVRLRFRLPTLRVYLFLLQYLFNDSVEILLAPLYWAVAGFGTGLDLPSSRRRHRRLQEWSVSLLGRRADLLLGMRIEIDAESRAALEPGPVIVISRHVSLFDASLPGLLYQQQGMAVRGVIMAELLADPGFDLIYGRLGSVFIPRDRGPEAIAEIRRMTDEAPPDTAYGIFPEGRLYHPKVRDRQLERLVQSDPDRAERLAGLSNVLPPRPGGLQALLQALPTADVVVIDHRGLDRVRSVKSLTEIVPLEDPITISVRRIARADIPTDGQAQVVWLDDLWLQLDRELSDGQPSG